jgi:hypothetical protein
MVINAKSLHTYQDSTKLAKTTEPDQRRSHFLEEMYVYLLKDSSQSSRKRALRFSERLLIGVRSVTTRKLVEFPNNGRRLHCKAPDWQTHHPIDVTSTDHSYIDATLPQAF